MLNGNAQQNQWRRVFFRALTIRNFKQTSRRQLIRSVERRSKGTPYSKKPYRANSAIRLTYRARCQSFVIADCERQKNFCTRDARRKFSGRQNRRRQPSTNRKNFPPPLSKKFLLCQHENFCASKISIRKNFMRQIFFATVKPAHK